MILDIAQWKNLTTCYKKDYAKVISIYISVLIATLLLTLNVFNAHTADNELIWCYEQIIFSDKMGGRRLTEADTLQVIPIEKAKVMFLME